jgi:tripartite-type tricarboxylate transporter receptor subunit TctC
MFREAHMHRVKLVSAAFLLAGSTALAPAWGQAFPAKPIRIIVTTPIGSAVDYLSRVVAQGLTETYKQQVIVDNRPGAGGLIGASLARTRSRPVACAHPALNCR